MSRFRRIRSVRPSVATAVVLSCTVLAMLGRLPECVDARAPFILPSSEDVGTFGALRQQRVGSSSVTLPPSTDGKSSGSSFTTTRTTPSSNPKAKTTPTATATAKVTAKTTTTTPTPTTTSTTTTTPPTIRARRTPKHSSPSPHRPIRVAYQGEPGAYSEKSLLELLGPNVVPVPYPNFDACYRAVASDRCDYACLPFENSLGGSIHENYDLMLRYDLKVVAEHDCRVSHCLHAVEGVDMGEVRYAMSHPQALAQCDGFLRQRGITPVPMYDTAGSVKLLAHCRNNELNPTYTEKHDDDDSDDEDDTMTLPGHCTTSNTAAIASDLAGRTYNTNCLQRQIEDDESNYTRFLLLARNGVSQYLKSGKDVPVKTSIVFTLPDNSAGALYKALACFSLRDIDFSKIESRPTSASLMNYLRYRNEAVRRPPHLAAPRTGAVDTGGSSGPRRFRYCFYLDFLASELDEDAINALHHLGEQAEFSRVLGSYPQSSALVGPVRDRVEEAKLWEGEEVRDEREGGVGKSVLNVGIVGFGNFGRLLGERFVKEGHRVKCIDTVDKAMEADEMGIEYYPTFEMESFLKGTDVLILAVPQIDFEATVSSLPTDLLHGKLIVEVCSLSTHPKSVLLQYTPPDVDVIVSNPMFSTHSSSSRSSTWDGQPMVYEKVRVRNGPRADTFLDVFERARCRMVEMSAEDQDSQTADAEFVTHLAGRLLDMSTTDTHTHRGHTDHGRLLPPTPVASREYAALLDVAAMTRGEPFDLFYGAYKFNGRAREYLRRMRDNLTRIETTLAAKEAYLAAKAEFRNGDRARLIAECRELFRDVAAASTTGAVGAVVDVSPSEENGTKQTDTK